MVAAATKIARLIYIFNNRFIVKNSFFNLGGQVAPLIGALFAIPYLLGVLGPDKLGVLALSWGIVGYFSLFDFGLGRALTQRVAVHLATNEHAKLPSTVWGALILLFIVGVIGSVVAYTAAAWIVFSVLKVPEILAEQTLFSFKLIAFSIPIIVLSSGLRGLLEGLGRFALLNWIRIPIGLLTYLLPLFVAQFNNELPVIVGSLIVLRFVGLIIQWLMCLKVMPSLLLLTEFRSIQFKPLLSFGGWMTVSNIVAPLMVYLDRFLIGSLVSLSAIAIYVIPYEVVTKLWIIAAAITSVLLPGFSSAFLQSREHLRSIYSMGMKVTFIFLTPSIIPLLFVSPELLQLWLGKAALAESVSVVRWISIGVLINSFAQVSFTLIQGVGRPDITAKLHLLEFPIYILLLYFLTVFWGVEGAAVAWTVRIGIDALLLLFISGRHLNFMPLRSFRFVIPLFFLIGICVASLTVEDSTSRWISMVFCEICSIAISWFIVIDFNGRRVCLHWVRQKMIRFNLI